MENIEKFIEDYGDTTRVSRWAKNGHDRLYFDLKKYNGGRNWNSGLAYHTCYVDLRTRTLVAKGVAGAATRDAHAEFLRELIEFLGGEGHIIKN